MNTKMKRTLWIIGVVIVMLAVVSGVGYFILMPKSPDPYTPPITDAEGNELPGSIAVIETITLFHDQANAGGFGFLSPNHLPRGRELWL